MAFPACGPKAKYNYARTLKPYDCWRLFIKDDFSENHRGNYLVEENTEALVLVLIHDIIEQQGIRRIIFVGSSKGGYEAINFSFHFKDVIVVAGAPQYLLGDYLNRPEQMPNLIDIVGEPVTSMSINTLNNRLRNKIRNSSFIPKAIFLHYSNEEHTYREHISYLIDDLRHRGIELHEDVKHYGSHMDLVHYYPPYLIKILRELIV